MGRNNQIPFILAVFSIDKDIHSTIASIVDNLLWLVLLAEDLSAAVYALNARMDAAQQWTDTIAAAVDDHANQLEAAARKIIVACATLTEFRAFVQEGQDGAAVQSKQLFERTDEVLLQLEAADAAMSATLEERISQLDAAMRELAGHTSARGRRPPTLYVWINCKQL